jgi:flavin-dependent dehydrogenase
MAAMTIERERLDADVLIVGAGPAGLACALRTC